jgi:hypothetical protein
MLDWSTLDVNSVDTGVARSVRAAASNARTSVSTCARGA